MSSNDTIVAPATPPGRGGIGVLRVSGPLVPEIAIAILGGTPAQRRATLATFRDAAGEAIDRGIAIYYPAPRSFTGEHVLELQGHGGPVVLEMLVERALELGARRALPGEFSERAFLNDRLDLTQAEAIADLIDAGSREAARAAVRSMQGEFADLVRALTEDVINLRVYVEAAIDFPEEEIDFLADEKLVAQLRGVVDHFDAVESSARRGRLLRDGMTVVIAGRPNAGKSSLLNRLAGYEAAIVTPVAGTTRDVLRERIDIDGLPLHVLDTAGLRETSDVVEAEGVRRAHAEIGRADRVLFVIDGAADPEGRAFDEERARLPPDVPVTILINKCDLPGSRPGTRTGAARSAGGAAGDGAADVPRIRVSARSGLGLRELREHLKDCIGYQTTEGGTVSARRRHLAALRTARGHVYEAARQLEQRRAGELVAEELRLAQRALDEITGQFHSDELLGRIFSSFCIGK